MPFASTSELLGQARDPTAPIKDAVTADGNVVVPIDVENFGLWLKAALGDPTSTGSAPGPYTHEFRSGSRTPPSEAAHSRQATLPGPAHCPCAIASLWWSRIPVPRG